MTTPLAPEGRLTTNGADRRAAASAPRIDDVRIKRIKELDPPARVLAEFPASECAAATTVRAREDIHRVLPGAAARLVVIIGPCSIHDVEAAREYGARLLAEKERFAND